MNELSIHLNNCSIGGDIGDQNYYLCYADDICLISQSSSGIQRLLNICNTYASEHSMLYNSKFGIPGMTLVAKRPHNKHGSSVFVRDGLNLNSISVCEEENVEFITVELPSLVVHSLYKPPPKPTATVPFGDTPQRIATGKWSNNG